MVGRYQERLSGPLLDRIGTLLDIEVPRVEYDKLSEGRLGEPSAVIQQRVEAARERQRQRFSSARLLSNADMGTAEVRAYCQLDDAG
jgi:magnesium chelatase family protein